LYSDPQSQTGINLEVKFAIMEETLKKITEFARIAHGEQQRKFAPDPYIVHPIRVMELCRKYSNEVTLLAAALLHDVLEDTAVTVEKMEDFLQSLMSSSQANETIQLVKELTDVYVKTNYPEWNRRKRKQKETERLSSISSKAQTIKYADIIDNSLDIVNVKNDFAKKYLQECLAIIKAMQKGNRELYEKALETVYDCLEKIKTGNG
jgi:guanosine-3',5'-bis(diphosphate) 3'-pyrophosphohydrolase